MGFAACSVVRGKEGAAAGHGALSAKAVLLCTVLVLFKGRPYSTLLLWSKAS